MAHRSRRDKPMHQRRWANLVALAIVAAAAVATVTFVVTRSDGGDSGRVAPIELDEEGGREDAVAACSAVVELIRQVRGNRPAEVVLDQAKEADELAARASRLDPVWTPLAGAVAAIRVGLEEDDPDAIRLGLQIVREACKGVGVNLG